MILREENLIVAVHVVQVQMRGDSAVMGLADEHVAPQSALSALHTLREEQDETVRRELHQLTIMEHRPTTTSPHVSEDLVESVPAVFDHEDDATRFLELSQSEPGNPKE